MTTSTKNDRRSCCNWRWLIAMACCLLPGAALAEDAPPAESQPAKQEAAKDQVSFLKQVAPILVKQCLACHGDRDPKGDFQLNSFANLLKGGGSGSPAISAGKPDESELYLLITEEDKSLRMPKEADRLPDESIALVERWIQQGAKFDGPDDKAPLVSLIPKLPQPDPPESYRVPVPVTALAFRPDGQELAVGGYHEITLWNPSDGKLLRRIKNVDQRTYRLAYSPDGSLLAAASGTPGQSGEIKLFKPADGTLVKELASLSDVAFGVAFSPDGKRLAACGADRSIRIFNVETGKEERLIEDHADWVMAVAWNHDGTKLASASRDKTSKVFDAATGEALTTYPGHGEPVFSVVFSADGSQVFTGGRDKQIHVWNPVDGKKAADIGGFGGELLGLALRQGQLYAVSADHLARQFKADSRELVRKFEGHHDYVYAAAVNEATQRLATGGYDGEVRVWNLGDGAGVATFFAAPGYAPAVAANTGGS